MLRLSLVDLKRGIGVRGPQQTWQWESAAVLLHTVTVVHGSISSEIGQHGSDEHLLLAAQGNCTLTSRRSSLRETDTDGGLKAVEGREDLAFHTHSAVQVLGVSVQKRRKEQTD